MYADADYSSLSDIVYKVCWLYALSLVVLMTSSVYIAVGDTRNITQLAM